MKRCKFFFTAFCIFAILTLLPTVTAFADFAPKPSVEVHVVNAPEGDYLIDFLVTEPRTEALPEPSDVTDKAEMTLRSYNKDGWHARCAGLNGLDYLPISNSENHIYKFTYQIPQQFRMIIVTADGKTLISSTVKPILYNTTVTFDAISGSLTESAASAGNSFVAGIKAMWPNFGITLGITVVVEAIVMALFFLKWKWHGWVKYVFVQILTQALLYLFLLICSMLGVLYLLKLPIAVVVIIVIEAALYDRFIETKFRGRMTFAAILANLASGALYYFIPQIWTLLP